MLSDPFCVTFVFRAQGFASMSGPCCAARVQRCHWEADGGLRVCPFGGPHGAGGPWGSVWGLLALAAGRSEEASSQP